MALFGLGRSEDELTRRFKNIVAEAKRRCIDVEPKFYYYVRDIKEGERESVIRPLGLFLDVVEMILSNRLDFKPADYYRVIYHAERLYKDIFTYDDKTPNCEDLQLVFTEFFEEGGVVAKNMYDPALFQTFYDKNNYIYLCKAIGQYPNIRAIFHELTTYGISIREYYIDDSEYLANLIRVAQELADTVTMQYDTITSMELLKIQRMNGFYNIDAVDIAKAEKQLLETKQIMEHSMEVINQIDQRSRQLQDLMEEITTSIRQIGKNEGELMQQAAETYKKELASEYKKELKTQKKQISLESSEFVKQMFEEATTELEQLRTMAKTIASSTSFEITKMNQDAEKVLRRVERMVNDDAEVRRILKQSEENQEFMQRVTKLEMLNDVNLSAIESAVNAQNLKLAKNDGEKAAVIIQQAPVAAVAGEVASSSNTSVTDRVIEPVNPLLDTSIPFRDRFAIVMAEKERRMARGEHFHEMFDDVLIALMEDSNPYLIGPSGCGKTYMIKQLTDLLHMDFIDIGYINEEYDILGYQTATGGYSAPNFYLCYKYGMVAFCDELDNGNSRATVKLNSFLSNVVDASYNFPNGENVKRHPNFRIIAAGNTAGNGADMNYNTREKIEESVQQRFVPIYVGYDNAVEEAILEGYTDWFRFIELFRAATDAWGVSSGMGSASGILTTRDATTIRRYLDNGSFDMERIIKYQFIQTKDLDYLLFLGNYMRSHIANYPEAQAIYENFMIQIEKIREDGGRR